MRRLVSFALATLMLVPSAGVAAAPPTGAPPAPVRGGTPDPACAADSRGVSFANPLRIPPELRPAPNGEPIEIGITQQAPQVLTSLDLSGTLPAQLLYNGAYPGPTIRVPSALADTTISSQGYQPVGPYTKVRFTNRLGPVSTVPFPYLTTHLHGGHTAPEHDGHPDDLFGPFPAPWPYPINEPLPPGQAAPETNHHTYSYTNAQQSQILWYHDHADGNTANHVAQGLFGFYLIEESDPAVVAALPPRAYDLPMGLQVLSGTGPGGQAESFLAINGVHHPVLRAAPRHYRLRFLNASVDEALDLVLCDGTGNRVDAMTQIGSDGGLLPAPVPRSRFEMFQAERYDMVVDLRGQRTLYLYATIRSSNYCTAIKDNVCQNTSLPVMRIDVDLPLASPDTTRLDRLGAAPAWDADSAFLRARYCEQKGLPPGCPLVPDRILEFDATPVDGEGKELMPSYRLNQQAFNKMQPTYAGVIDPVTGATRFYPEVIKPTIVPGNTVEVWEIRNRIPCVSHPLHIHDIEFQTIAVDGRPVDPAQFGWKDVFVLRPLAGADCAAGVDTAPERSVTMIGYFEAGWTQTDVMDSGEDLMHRVQPVVSAQNEVTYWKSSTSGLYVFHCHNLFHEDDSMMGQMLVDPPPLERAAARGRR